MSEPVELARISVWVRDGGWFLRSCDQARNGTWWTMGHHLGVVKEVTAKRVGEAILAAVNGTVRDIDPPVSLREPPPDARKAEMLAAACVTSLRAFNRDARFLQIDAWTDRFEITRQVKAGAHLEPSAMMPSVRLGAESLPEVLGQAAIDLADAST